MKNLSVERRDRGESSPRQQKGIHGLGVFDKLTFELRPSIKRNFAMDCYRFLGQIVYMVKSQGKLQTGREVYEQRIANMTSRES